MIIIDAEAGNRRPLEILSRCRADAKQFFPISVLFQMYFFKGWLVYDTTYRTKELLVTAALISPFCDSLDVSSSSRPKKKLYTHEE